MDTHSRGFKVLLFAVPLIILMAIAAFFLLPPPPPTCLPSANVSIPANPSSSNPAPVYVCLGGTITWTDGGVGPNWEVRFDSSSAPTPFTGTSAPGQHPARTESFSASSPTGYDASVVAPKTSCKIAPVDGQYCYKYSIYKNSIEIADPHVIIMP
jgi:hypothetical protein